MILLKIEFNKIILKINQGFTLGVVIKGIVILF